jgi:hypothetical protein
MRVLGSMVKVELDASRRWVTLAKVHPTFASAVEGAARRSSDRAHGTRWFALSPEVELRNSEVAVLRGEPSFVVGEVGVTNGDHERPVLADRAVLNPGDAEVDGLQLDSRDPQRREEVALPAPDHGIPPDLVAQSARNHRSEDEHGNHHDDWA